ncbi:MAG: DUF58 domain-containing protein [Microthrixaceae bacterium]
MRPTPALVVLVALLVVVAGLRPAVAAPAVTSLIWVGVASIVAIGVLGPLMGARRRTVTAESYPTDVLEGEEFAVVLRVSGGNFPLVVGLDPSLGALGTPGRSGLGTVVVDPSGSRCLATLRRGVHRSLLLETVDSAPFGLLRVSRAESCGLDHPLWVGPTSDPWSGARSSTDSGGDRTANPVAAGHGDTIRTVRSYSPGDPPHLVHWPTSARVAELMVRELEPPIAPRTVIVLDLGPSLAGAGTPADGSGTSEVGGGADRIDAAVRSTAGLCHRALDEGSEVVLCCSIAGRPSVEYLHDHRGAQRVLASVTAGVPGSAPRGTTPILITPAGGARQ